MLSSKAPSNSYQDSTSKKAKRQKEKFRKGKVKCTLINFTYAKKTGNQPSNVAISEHMFCICTVNLHDQASSTVPAVYVIT